MVKKKPVTRAEDCRLVVLKRIDDDFEGEFWWGGDRRGIEIKGTFKTNAVQFTPVRNVRGDGNDIVNSAKFAGRLNDKTIRGRFTVPGTDARYGEIEVTLKE